MPPSSPFPPPSTAPSTPAWSPRPSAPTPATSPPWRKAPLPKPPQSPDTWAMAPKPIRSPSLLRNSLRLSSPPARTASITSNSPISIFPNMTTPTSMPSASAGGNLSDTTMRTPTPIIPSLAHTTATDTPSLVCISATSSRIIHLNRRFSPRSVVKASSA